MSLTERQKQKAIGLFFLAFALTRILFKFLFSMMWVGLVFLCALSLFHNLKVFPLPMFGRYLEKLDVGNALTALGILLASYGVMSAWRMQKREELLLSTADEVDLFFRRVVLAANRMCSQLMVLEDFRSRTSGDSYDEKEKYFFGYVSGVVKEIEEDRSVINDCAIRVHDLSSRESLAIWSIPLARMRFEAAVNALDALCKISFMNLPVGCSSVDELVNRLRLIDGAQYVRFCEEAPSLAGVIAGSIGGIRGSVLGRYFPPTISGARAFFDMEGE